MRLLERDDALGRLREATEQAAGGAGRVVVVGGEAGVGKTTLVRRFASELDDGVRVLWGACDDLTVPQPLGPLLEIAEQTGGLLLPAVQGGDPREVGRTLRAVLAEDVPRVCVLEDCHWADEATLDVLAHVARRLRGLHAVLLVTFRDEGLGADHRLRAVIGSIPPDDLVRVPLRPLSRAAVGELAGADADVDALYAATGGNPFLVTEMLAAGTGGEAGPVPPTVRDAVLARAARLGPAARALLEAVSVIPARAELWLVEELLGPVAEAVEECERSGLLVVEGQTLHYRHELARLAYARSLPSLRSVELNRAILRVLEERRQDPARLVHHAEQAHDHRALARHAMTAGRRAARSRSHREAVALFERALRHPQALEPAERAAAYEALSEEAYIDGRSDLALSARQSALALRREQGDLRAVGVNLCRLSRLQWWTGRRREAEETAEQAVELLRRLGPSRELALAYSHQSNLLMLVQRTGEAITVGEKAMELARVLGDTATLLDAQTNVGSARMFHDPDGGRELLRRAGETALACDLEEDVDHIACRAFHNIASIDFDHFRLREARPRIEHALSVARKLEQWWFEADTLILRAIHDLACGRWQAAVTTVEELLGSAELPSVSEAPALRVLAAVELRRGGRQAHSLIEQAWRLARPTEELQWMRPAAALRAEAAWLVGDVRGVREATDAVYPVALEHGHAWDIGELAVWRWRAGLLQAAPPRCAEPHALSIAGDWEGAAAAWERIGAPYERALALCDAPDPQAVLTGLGILDELGASAPARLVRRRLQRLGVRNVPRGPRPATRAHPAGLSRRQAEVLELVAAGMSNAEIAKTLFLTPKTVEHHVSAILRKLRVDSRAAAAEAARSLGLVRPPAASG